MISLYRRVESLLRSKILSGKFESGEKLPTENEFVEQFGVSKITIRRALSRLEGEGLITRRSGKGTFVSSVIPVTKQFTITNNVRDIVVDAQRYEVKLHSFQPIQVKDTRIPKEIQSFFGFSNGDEIFRIQRLRLLKGIPIYFLENFLPVDTARHITKKDLHTKPLLQILKERIGLRIGGGDIYIEAVPADPDIADILQCQTYDPLIFRQIYYRYSTNDPFEIVISFMRAEYFKYKGSLKAENF